MEIAAVDLKAQYHTIKKEIDEAVMRVVESQTFILGDPVAKFEAEAATYLGVKHAIGVANGSDALFLALLALDIHDGEVPTVPHTYVATPESISRVGAKPVFVDVDPGTWNMDPSKLKAAVNKNTRAIMPVHIFGQCADMEGIRAAAGGLPIVEDAAQAWGAAQDGTKAGNLGTIACFSFYPTKTLGAFGDGGMVTTNDDNLAARVRSLRVHGESRRYYNSLHGVNSRLDAIQAAVLSVKLRHVDKWNTGRAEISAYYRNRFVGKTPRMSSVGRGNHHVWHQCTILVPRRDELQKYLKDKGIGTAIYYPVPQHLQAVFSDLNHKRGDFPVCESISDQGLAIPCWPEMTQAQRDFVADTVLGFFGEK